MALGFSLVRAYAEGEGGRSMYGLGEKLRSEDSGRIMSAQDRVGERGDGSPPEFAAGTGAVRASAMTVNLVAKSNVCYRMSHSDMV